MMLHGIPYTWYCIPTHWILHGLAATQDTAAQSAQLDTTPASKHQIAVDGIVAEHAMDHRPPVPPPQRYQTTRNGWTEVMLFVKEVRRGEETAEEYQVVKTWKTR
jgi:hypothetical protein